METSIDTSEGLREARERALRGRALAGDEAAWESLLSEAIGPVERYVRARCAGRPGLADEVLQETWLVAVRRLRDFDPARAPFRAWVRGIAERIRRSGRQEAKSTAALPTEAAQPPGLDPVEVRWVLDELPARFREVLFAKYVEGLDVAAIAERCGRTAKAVESLLSRARTAFRVAWQEMGA